jgi:hypothetical protein
MSIISPTIITPITPFGFPLFTPPISRQNKIDIKIGKKTSGSALTDSNIQYLRGKVNVLNQIYNIIFKHLCYKKNVDRNWDLLQNVKSDINTQLPNYLNDFCLGSVNTPNLLIDATRQTLLKQTFTLPGTTDAEAIEAINKAKFYLFHIANDSSYAKKPLETAIETALGAFTFKTGSNEVDKITTGSKAVKATEGEVVTAINAIKSFITDYNANPNSYKQTKNTCNVSMFDDTKLTHLINNMYVDSLLNKACVYRRYNATGDIANVQVGGVDQTYDLIDVAELLKENNRTESKLNILCIKHGNQINCKNMSNQTQSQVQAQSHCSTCGKWAQERDMFRGVLKDLLMSQNMNETFGLMNASVHLLPSAILNQSQYEAFHADLNEYKKIAQNKLNK